MGKSMKGLCLVLLTTVFFLTACASEKSNSILVQDEGNESKELNLYTWEGYVPKEVIMAFENNTGINVKYTAIRSQETLYEDISQSPVSYDLVICGDVAVDRMRSIGGIMAEIDKSRLVNFRNISPEFLNKEYDPGNKYSVPYAYGHALIVYNPGLVPFEVTGYKDLWDPEFAGSLVMIDSMRNTIAITLKKMGYSFNETDPNVLGLAKEQLMLLKPNMKALEYTNLVNSFIENNAKAGFMFSWQASELLSKNPNLKAVYPQEGLAISVDSFVIPQNAKHKNNAYKFIDYILDGAVNAKIVENIRYGTVNAAAKEFLSKEYLENKMINVSSEYLKGAESIIDVGDALPVYQEIWNEFKEK